MDLSQMICKLRTDANLSQERFAALFDVSRQSVQKWETGASVPELDNLIKMAKLFDISLDTLVLDSDSRMREELKVHKAIKPRYENQHGWESYSANLQLEYEQSMDEGLDVENYAEVFASIGRLPQNETRKSWPISSLMWSSTRPCARARMNPSRLRLICGPTSTARGWAVCAAACLARPWSASAQMS